MDLAREMAASAASTGRARDAMWAALWRMQALIEEGRLNDAQHELMELEVVVEQVGGPVSAWHLDCVAACIALGQARYADAAGLGRQARERMASVEPRPARGAYLSLLSALSGHIGVTDDMAPFVEKPFEPLPLYRMVAPLHRAVLLLRAGMPEEAAASFRRLGPVETWSLPVFYAGPCYVFAVLVTVELGFDSQLAGLLERLEPFRGSHVAGDVVVYLGPAELALGRGAAALGDIDRAIADFATAAVAAERAGALGYFAEANYHLGGALMARNAPGDRPRALSTARVADQLARSLGMAAYTERTAMLVSRASEEDPSALTRREWEVAHLVAGGLTNRQVGSQLIISERTAQNHVQHILTKLGFATRSQIAAWVGTQAKK
jgi:DNA-binding CsgD family transcriptional regulator